MKMKFLTTKEAVKIIEQNTNKPIGIRQLEQQIKRGLLRAQKVGRDYLIDPDDLKSYKRKKAGRPVDPNSKRQKEIQAKKLKKQKRRLR